MKSGNLESSARMSLEQPIGQPHLAKQDLSTLVSERRNNRLFLCIWWYCIIFSLKCHNVFFLIDKISYGCYKFTTCMGITIKCYFVSHWFQDVAKLNPLSPEVISRQATINIGTIGHVAHGKSTVVKAISGVQTVRFKNELERNITIKLGKLLIYNDNTCEVKVFGLKYL